MKRLAAIPVVLAVLTMLLEAEAQPPVKMPRIGVLSGGDPVPYATRHDRQGLRELGYVEAKSIVLDYRYAEGKSERLPDPRCLCLPRDTILSCTPGDAW